MTISKIDIGRKKNKTNEGFGMYVVYMQYKIWDFANNFISNKTAIAHIQLNCEIKMLYRILRNGKTFDQWSCNNFSDARVGLFMAFKYYRTQSLTHSTIGCFDGNFPYLKYSCVCPMFSC